MPRFAIGESVGLNGLLGEIHGGKTGMVVSVLRTEIASLPWTNTRSHLTVRGACAFVASNLHT